MTLNEEDFLTKQDTHLQEQIMKKKTGVSDYMNFLSFINHHKQSEKVKHKLIKNICNT